MGLYQIRDYWQRSPMEKEYDKYETAISAVDGYLSLVNSALNEIEENIDKITKRFLGYYSTDGSQGMFVSEFEAKASYVSWELTILYTAMLQNRDHLQSTKSTLEYRLGRLKSYCQKEDDNEEYIQLSAIKW